MAIEDGAALAEAIHFASSRDDIPTCLDVWQRVRIKRTSQMQQASLFGAHIWHIADGPEQIARDAAMSADVEGTAAESSPNLWSDPTTQRWSYGYDAEREIAAEWAYHRKARL
jgi:salicylate hydroxylase